MKLQMVGVMSSGPSRVGCIRRPSIIGLRCLFGRVVVALALVMACLRLNAQPAGGTVTFGNKGSAKVINGQTGNPVTTSDQIQAALYWAPLGSNTFVQIGSALTYVGTPLPGLFAGGTRTTGPATTGGSLAQFQVRAWSGKYASYELAAADPTVLLGQSTTLQASTGNPAGAPPTPPAALVGLQGFTLVLNTGATPPTAGAGGNQTICAGSSTAPLGGSVGGGATGGTWTTSGSGAFSNPYDVTNATYNPSQTDITIGTVTLTLTSTGPLPPATAQVIATINAAATATSGGNQTICAGGSTAALGGSVGGGATGGLWSSSGTGTFLPNATTLNAMYSPSAADVTAGAVTLTLTSTGQLAPCGAATAQVLLTLTSRPAKRFYRLVSSQQPAFTPFVLPTLPIIAITRSGTTVTLSWFQAGITYVVQFANDLRGPWANLPGGVTINGSTATMTDSIGGCP